MYLLATLPSCGGDKKVLGPKGAEEDNNLAISELAVYQDALGSHILLTLKCTYESYEDKTLYAYVSEIKATVRTTSGDSVIVYIGARPKITYGAHYVGQNVVPNEDISFANIDPIRIPRDRISEIAFEIRWSSYERYPDESRYSVKSSFVYSSPFLSDLSAFYSPSDPLILVQGMSIESNVFGNAVFNFVVSNLGKKRVIFIKPTITMFDGNGVIIGNTWTYVEGSIFQTSGGTSTNSSLGYNERAAVSLSTIVDRDLLARYKLQIEWSEDDFDGRKDYLMHY